MINLKFKQKKEDTKASPNKMFLGNDIFADYKKLSQKLTILSSGMFGVIICLTVLLLSLFPLKGKVPFLIKLTAGGDLIDIVPILANQEGQKLLIESLCIQFVSEFEAFDLRTDKVKFNKLSNRCSKGVWQQLRLVFEGNDSEYFKRKHDNITRSIRILSCNRVSRKHPFTYLVEWESTDRQGGKVLMIKQWTSTLNIHFKKQEKSFDERYENPTGFVVNEYVKKQKGVKSV